MPPLTRRILIQLAIFGIVAVVGGAVMAFGYMQLPAMFGVGRYRITVELPQAAGLYVSGNVTYRGTEVGRVESVRLTETGVAAVLSLKSGVDIPSDLDAQVHSQSAVGEQYVALLPRRDSAPLKNGDVIPRDRVSVPPDLDTLLDSVNRGMESIPRENLKTVVDEAYTAVGGLGPDLSRLVTGTSTLSTDARKNLGPLLTLIDQSKPVLDSPAASPDAVQQWAAHLADITAGLQRNNSALQGVLRDAGPAAAEVRQLFDRLNPTLPVLLANMIGVGQVALTYHAGIEQLLVLLPQAVATIQAIGVPNRNTKQSYRGVFLSFNLRLNLPPPCTTGYLPAQQQRVPSWEDYPDRPPGDLYCRVPQDSPQQRPRRPQHTVCRPAWQARPDGRDVRERRALRAAQRRLQLERRPECHSVGSAHSAAAAGHAAPAGAPVAGPCTACHTGCRVRPGYRHLCRPGRARVHPIRPGQGWRKGTDMADDVAASDRELSADDGSTHSGHGADRLALVIGLVVVVALSGLVGWLGLRAYQSHRVAEQRQLFLQVGRQGALNLTTVDFHEAKADVQRILDGATGHYYDNFSERSQPYLDAVLRTQSKTVGTVTEAALESQSGDRAQVLVAVAVKTSNAVAGEQEPRLWRMRLVVQRVGDGAKVADVEFVS